MDPFLLVFLFLFGLVIGSFLNVVILRYNTGKSLKGRSACFSCGTTLKWHHLIPLISFLAQRGKCVFCQSKISVQYPLVELATGIMFVLFYLQSSIFNLPIVLVVASLLIVIFVYDLRHKIIPDGIVFALMAIGLIVLFQRQNIFADLASAFFIFLFFFSLWYFSKGTWMGLGDGKLALAIGLFLPYPWNLTAIILSFWIGAIFGLLLMAYERLRAHKAHKAVFWGPQKTALCAHRHTMKSELPFAPFMIIGFFLVLSTQLNLVTLLVL